MKKTKSKIILIPIKNTTAAGTNTRRFWGKIVIYVT